MADSANASQASLEDVIQEVLQNLNLIQRGQGNEDLLKKQEAKKDIVSYLVEINQLIEQIEAFIDRLGILESTREMLHIGHKQVKPRKFLENLKEIREQLDMLLTLLDDAGEFSSNCISCLCQMVHVQGVQIPKLEQFNISEISTISISNIFRGATQVITSESFKEIISCLLENNAAMQSLIVALSTHFVWINDIKALVVLGVGAGAGGMLLKAGFDDISRCLENNEVFYQELGNLEAEILKCGIKAKLTTLLSLYPKQLDNRKNAELIIKIRNSYNQVLTSIQGAKSLAENDGKSNQQILEEMSVNQSFNGLVEPVKQELKCNIETAWMVMGEILARQ